MYVGGLAVGFLVPTLPFAALAPKRFYQSLYVAQVAPRAGSTRVPLPARLSHMLGIINLPLPAHPRKVILAATAVLVIVVAAMIAVAWVRLRQAAARAGLVRAGHHRGGHGHVHVAGPVPLPFRRVPGAVLRHVHRAAPVPPAGGARPGRQLAARG